MFFKSIAVIFLTANQPEKNTQNNPQVAADTEIRI